MQLDKKGCKEVEQIIVIRCQAQSDQHSDQCASEFIAIPSITEISQVCFSSLSQLHFSVMFVSLPVLFMGFLFPLVS